ncbi:MAG TPA: class II aldolase/adducin family protein [Gemmatimonadaceae bacterium]
MGNETDLDEVLRDLVIANRILAREGVLDGFGHVSVRHPGDPARYFMSRSRSPELVTREDLIEFTLENRPVEPDGRAMYAERYIHGCLYRARPDVRAVCHNHSHAVIPYAVSGQSIRPVMHMASVIGDEVPVWDIRDEFGDTDLLVTNDEMGRSLARCLGERRAALMRGHGGVVVGGSLREAVFTAIYLQLDAELLLRARLLGDGTVNYLTPGEVRLASQTLLQPLSQDRAWEYWSARAGYG